MMENDRTLTLADAQRLVDDWIMDVGKGYFSELTNMALLAEEVGELARVMARTYGDQRPKIGEPPADNRLRLAEELADVLWVTICLANQTGTDLTGALRDSLAKKNARDRGRWG